MLGRIFNLAKAACRLQPGRALVPRNELCYRQKLHSYRSLEQRIDKQRLEATSSARETESSASLGEDIKARLPSNCSGCGVELQQEDSNAPGYFQIPKRVIEQLQAELEEAPEEATEAEDADAEGRQGADVEEQLGDAPSDASPSSRGPDREAEWQQFDSMVESWLDEPPRQPRVQAYGERLDDGLHVLCARCFSLRNYGQVKSAEAEASLPGFDFMRRVGRKIALQKFRRSILLVVVDVADYDGSLPRQAVRSLLTPEELEGDVTRRLPRNFRMVVAVNKGDLLPNQVTPTRLEAWVRRRMAQGGLPRPSAVHLVSSVKGWGVKELLADLQRAAGTRGDVWVMGAQNAGKSSLINAMRGAVGLSSDRNVTAAALPGTTLGTVTVPGLLPPGSKMLDTPGVPHPYQLASQLTAEEMRMVLPRRQLRPRTFRLGAGQTVMLGALARLDVLSCPGATMYLTVWASDEVVTHLGKTEGAEERLAKHGGSKLAPPLGGAERMASLPPVSLVEVSLEGDSWRESTRDIAIAGLGWVGVGVSGQCTLRVWAPKGVAITTHDALVPDFAKQLERPGFGGLAPEGVEGGGGGGLGKGGGGGKAKRGGKGRR